MWYEVCVFGLEHGQGVVVEALQRQKGRGGVIRLTKTALCLGRTLRSQAVWEKQAAARLLHSKHIVRAAQERQRWRGGTRFDILTHTQAVVYGSEPPPPPPPRPWLWNKGSFPTTGWQVSPGDLPASARWQERRFFSSDQPCDLLISEAHSTVIYWEISKLYMRFWYLKDNMGNKRLGLIQQIW